jgi:bone morphogenetic protein 7
MYGLPTGEAHPSGLRHERGRRLWFDVSEVPIGERIVSAELRLFLSDGTAPQRATVSVYQLVADDRG